MNTDTTDRVGRAALPMLLGVLAGAMGLLTGCSGETVAVTAVQTAGKPAGAKDRAGGGPAAAGAIAGGEAKADADGESAAGKTESAGDAGAGEAAKPIGASLKLDTEFVSAKRIVPFAFSQVGVGPVGTLAVQELAPLAKQAQAVYIRGRTDARGNVEQNRQVALNRAYTVRTAFVKAGVQKSKLRISYCTSCFIASNDTEEGRRANRRVDVELVMPAEELARLPKPVYALEYPNSPEQRLALAQSLEAVKKAVAIR